MLRWDRSPATSRDTSLTTVSILCSSSSCPSIRRGETLGESMLGTSLRGLLEPDSSRCGEACCLDCTPVLCDFCGVGPEGETSLNATGYSCSYLLAPLLEITDTTDGLSYTEGTDLDAGCGICIALLAFNILPAPLEFLCVLFAKEICLVESFLSAG